MKTKSEIQEKITNYSAELDELERVKEHCASMGWWSIVNEIKKLVNIRNRDKRLLEDIIV